MAAFNETLLARLSLTCSEIRQAFAQHIGMSATRLQMLMLLSHGETSHAELQRRLFLDGATLTRQVKQYEAEGVVTRRLDPKDNRYTLVSLTPSGEKIAAGLIVAYDAFQTRLLSGIDEEEQQAVLRLMEQLRANIRSIEEE